MVGQVVADRREVEDGSDAEGRHLHGGPDAGAPQEQRVLHGRRRGSLARDAVVPSTSSTPMARPVRGGRGARGRRSPRPGSAAPVPARGRRCGSTPGRSDPVHGDGADAGGVGLVVVRAARHPDRLAAGHEAGLEWGPGRLVPPRDRDRAAVAVPLAVAELLVEASRTLRAGRRSAHRHPSGHRSTSAGSGVDGGRRRRWWTRNHRRPDPARSASGGRGRSRPRRPSRRATSPPG